MNMDNLFSSISNNQKKLILALLDHPEGLLSNELAEITAVSNKSATMTQDVRDLLQSHGLELTIEREKGRAKWVLRRQERDVAMKESTIFKLRDAVDQLARTCQEIRQLLA